jgi:multimeric flavodoxin WrbA
MRYEGGPMHVFAINSSARVGGESKTELVLDYLVEGMKAEGADVEVANIFKKKINYCIGCYSCWTKTPGKCVHQDDMSKELYSKYINADLVVLASPLYHGTLNANMKAFLERMLPSSLPFSSCVMGEQAIR